MLDLLWYTELAVLCAACLVGWHWRSNTPIAICALIVMLPAMWIMTYVNVCMSKVRLDCLKRP